MIETVFTCPLGHTCTEVKENKLHRCAWLVEMQGKHPSTGEDVKDEKCSLAWLPILQIEMANTNRGQTAALESFRNETVKGNEQFLSIVAQRALNNA